MKKILSFFAGLIIMFNGAVVVENGQHTGARPGRILHGPGYLPGPQNK